MSTLCQRTSRGRILCLPTAGPLERRVGISHQATSGHHSILGYGFFLFYIQKCSKNFHSYQCSFRIPNIYFLIYLHCLKFSGVFLPQCNILLLSYSNFPAWPQTPNFFYPQALVLIQKSIHSPYDFPILFIPNIFIHLFLLVGDLFHEQILLSHFFEQ